MKVHTKRTAYITLACIHAIRHPPHPSGLVSIPSIVRCSLIVDLMFLDMRSWSFALQRRRCGRHYYVPLSQQLAAWPFCLRFFEAQVDTQMYMQRQNTQYLRRRLRGILLNIIPVGRIAPYLYYPCSITMLPVSSFPYYSPVKEYIYIYIYIIYIFMCSVYVYIYNIYICYI